MVELVQGNWFGEGSLTRNVNFEAHMHRCDTKTNDSVFILATLSGRMVYLWFTWCRQALKLSCARTKEVCMLPSKQYSAYRERNRPPEPIEYVSMSLVYTGWDPILIPSLITGTPTARSQGQDTPRSRRKPDRTPRSPANEDGVHSPKSPSQGTSRLDPDAPAVTDPFTHQR